MADHNAHRRPLRTPMIATGLLALFGRDCLRTLERVVRAPLRRWCERERAGGDHTFAHRIGVTIERDGRTEPGGIRSERDHHHR